MQTITELNKHFSIDELEKQLESVVNSKDPVGYMQSNINWEIDKNLDGNDKELRSLTKLMSIQLSPNESSELWNPFREFLDWFSRNKVAGQITKILCSINNKLKELIDEKAELKTILGFALTTIATAIGIGAINPVVLTLLVGILATMILEGVSNVCGV